MTEQLAARPQLKTTGMLGERDYILYIYIYTLLYYTISSLIYSYNIYNNIIHNTTDYGMNMNFYEYEFMNMVALALLLIWCTQKVRVIMKDEGSKAKRTNLQR